MNCVIEYKNFLHLSIETSAIQIRIIIIIRIVLIYFLCRVRRVPSRHCDSEKLAYRQATHYTFNVCVRISRILFLFQWICFLFKYLLWLWCFRVCVCVCETVNMIYDRRNSFVQSEDNFLLSFASHIMNHHLAHHLFGIIQWSTFNYHVLIRTIAPGVISIWDGKTLSRNYLRFSSAGIIELYWSCWVRSHISSNKIPPSKLTSNDTFRPIDIDWKNLILNIAQAIFFSS